MSPLKFSLTYHLIARVFDIIGDIHGHIDALRGMLHLLGYHRSGESWTNHEKNRQIIFLGDFIDRGPHIPETVALVRQLINEGIAQAVMGNHEYNALTWHHRDTSGGWLRSHNSVHRRQHWETLRQYGMDPEGDEAPNKRLSDDLQWMRTLPLFIETDQCIVAHAAWEERALVDIGHDPYVLRDDEALVRSAYGEYRESRSVEKLLKGVEISLPPGVFYHDKDGAPRQKTRVAWWVEHSEIPDPVTMAQIAMPPAAALLSTVTLPRANLAEIPGYHDPRLFFMGHYWLHGVPQPLTDKVACLDYSVARGGTLCAYQFRGETALQQEHFCAVTPRGEPIKLRVTA